MFGNHSTKPQHTSHDRLLRYAESLGFGDIHFKIDHKTGLHAIVAIHSTKLGPALGGCRFIHYDSADDALIDALRLAHMMSFKAAVSNVAHGGAKAVIMKPKTLTDRAALFNAYGEFVNDLGGRYITAVDSGTGPADMDEVAKKTSFVTCTTEKYAGDPSPVTALGVRRGIEAAVKFRLDRDNLEDIHVAIQGAGHVGYYLAKELLAKGAHITITDVNQQLLAKVTAELGIASVAPEAIYSVPCDVFAPCALGGILNGETIPQLRTPIVAGSANNQLAHHEFAHLMMQHDILYAPDFVINAGGLIHVAAIYDHGDSTRAQQQIYELYDILLQLFERAQQEHKPTSEVAELIALEKLQPC